MVADRRRLRCPTWLVTEWTVAKASNAPPQPALFGPRGRPYLATSCCLWPHSASPSISARMASLAPVRLSSLSSVRQRLPTFSR
jgi:hypothetical protein